MLAEFYHLSYSVVTNLGNPLSYAVCLNVSHLSSKTRKTQMSCWLTLLTKLVLMGTCDPREIWTIVIQCHD